MQSAKQHNDIIIVGAGIIGLTTALALSRLSHLSIAIIDQQDFLREPSKEKISRVSAITQASKNIFLKLGIWSTLKNLSAFSQMSIWDSDGHTCHLHAKDNDLSELGFIVENDLIQQALLQALQDKHNVTFYANVELKTLEKTAEGIQLNHQYSADLLCGADGARSWVRAQNHIEQVQMDYEQSAIVANIKTEKPHAQIAKQFFLEEGPLAFLPLKDEFSCSIVWSANHLKTTTLMGLSDADFCDQLSKNSRGELGRILQISNRQSHPLTMRQAKHYAQDHIVLLGDAAHTLHPLAGLGLNLGLLDVAYLYDVIFANVLKKRRYYLYYNLRRFERLAKVQNAEKIKVINVLKNIFEQQKKPLPFWRGLGLSILNNQALLKRICIGYATGDNQPTLAKPSKER